MRFLIHSALCLGLTACFPTYSFVSGTPTTVTSYELGEFQSAGIGDPIFDVQAARAVPAFRATRDFDLEDEDLPDLREGMGFLATRRRNDDSYYLLVSPDFSEDWLLMSDEDGNLMPGLYHRSRRRRAHRDIEWPQDLLTPDLVMRDQEEGFRAQMLYSGMDGSTIRGTYREFSGDFIRPAFSQELQYDLALDSVIAYRSIRIRITSATNERLEYIVVEDDDLPWLPIGAP